MPSIAVHYKIRKEDLADACWEEAELSRMNIDARLAAEEIEEAKDVKEAYKIFKEVPECDINMVIRRKFDKIDFKAVSRLIGKEVVDIDEGPTEFITESDRQIIKYYDSEGRIYQVLVVWEKETPLTGRFIFHYNPHLYG